MQSSRQCISSLITAATSLMQLSCASYSPNNLTLGSRIERANQILGQPSTDLKGAESKVVSNPRGPFGKHTYFVYLNRDGSMKRRELMLN